MTEGRRQRTEDRRHQSSVNSPQKRQKTMDYGLWTKKGQRTEDISHQSSVISHQSTARRRDKRLWTMDYGL